MLLLGIIIALIAALHIWLSEPNVAVKITLAKGLMFGFVFGSFYIEEEEVTAHHYQLCFLCLILTLEWYVEQK